MEAMCLFVLWVLEASRGVIGSAGFVVVARIHEMEGRMLRLRCRR